MKKFRIIAFAVAMLMLTASFVGCTTVEKVTLNAVVTIVVNGENLLGPVAVEVETTADEPVTVLLAALTAFDNNEIDYVADEYSITSIGEYADKTEGGYTYFWEYTINGEKVETGRAGTNQIKEGDEIVFTYVAESTEELIKEAEEDEK